LGRPLSQLALTSHPRPHGSALSSSRRLLYQSTTDTASSSRSHRRCAWRKSQARSSRVTGEPA
jgi:hypothetical protein